MNWLAHLLLAESDPEISLGNLLGDLIKGKQRQALNYKFQKGLKCHQAIDIFTDKHPIVKRSKRRIDSKYRRFSGILIDVFYDHILANNWQHYSNISLEEFTSTVYNSWDGYLAALPIYPQGVINRLIAEDWLGSYINVLGIEQTLARISWRLNKKSGRKASQRHRRHYDLTPAVQDLIINYSELEQDFKLFFPELQLHIDNWYLTNK